MGRHSARQGVVMGARQSRVRSPRRGQKRSVSGTVAPTVSWSAREWLALTVAGMVSVPGRSSLGGLASDGNRYTEFGVTPMNWRVFASARLFY